VNQEDEGGGFYTHLNQELMTFSFVEIQRSVQHNDAGCRTDSKLCLGAHRFIVAECVFARIIVSAPKAMDKCQDRSLAALAQ
jgi:hypothetical protein